MSRGNREIKMIRRAVGSGCPFVILQTSQGGGSMANMSRFTIICPCCEATLTVDAETGVILSHDEKAKPLASFDEMVKGLDKQKQVREQIFAQELSSMK